LRQAYVKTLLDAEQLRLKGKHERAEELLRQTIAGGPPDTRAAQLLQSVTAERGQKEREKAIARARQEADCLAKEGKQQEALGLLDRICREYPDDFELADHRRDLEARAEKQRQDAQRLELERRHAAERTRKVASCRAAVDAAVAEREWERALQAIDLAERELPGEPAFAELRVSVALERRREGLEELDRAVRQSFGRRDLDGAARQLAAARLDFSGEPLWQSLDEELSRLREYARLLAEAEGLIVAAKYETAQKKLREAIAIGPTDGRAETLLKDIEDEKNARRRLALQFRLMVRKYRGIIKWAGIAALLLVVTGVAVRTFLRPSPVLITLRPEPAEVRLSYRVGGDLPSQIIDFKSAGVKFEVSPAYDWLKVTPQKGDRLGRLEVRVTKDLNVGSQANLLVVHASGAANNPVTIPVHLTVVGVEAPTPVPLKLEREELTFTYTQNGATPGPESIRAKQGDIGNATTKTEWLNPDHKTNSVSVGLLPKYLQPLRVGNHDGIVKVKSADPHVQSIDVIVHLTVLEPPPKPKEPPKVEVTQPGPPPKKEETKSGPPPTRRGKGCSTGMYSGPKSGTSIWTGLLLPGAYVDILPEIPVDDPPPTRLRLTIGQPTPSGVSVVQSPAPDNACGPVRLFNDSKNPIKKIQFGWKAVEK
jgi:tetratricopeptide (TPR) repeat protein